MQPQQETDQSGEFSGKKKINKPKLTAKEKLAEKRRRAEERKKQLKRDHLSREIRYGTITYKSFEKQWKEMLIRIALPRMRQELNFAWNNFERIVDYKDFTISLLMDEIRDAEEQYMMNFRNHQTNIDRLIAGFRDRIEELKEDHTASIEELQKDNSQHVEWLGGEAEDEERTLNIILYGLQQRFKDQERQIRIEYVSRLDEQDSKCQNLIQRMRTVEEKAVNELWDRTERFLEHYFHSTKERRRDQEALKIQDDAVQELIRRQLGKIVNAHGTIKTLRERLTDLQRIVGMKLNDLLIERRFFGDAFMLLKERLEAVRKFDEVKLLKLTTNCHEVLNHLGEVVRRGEHTLHIGAICRKLETQKEKVLPFPVEDPMSIKKPTHPSAILDQRATLENNAPLEGEDLDKRMTLFWQRVGQANALRFAINEERVFLQLANKMLRKHIHNHTCTFCSSKKRFKVYSSNVIDGNAELEKYAKQFGNCRNFTHVSDICASTERFAPTYKLDRKKHK